MKKIIRLTESDLTRIVKRVVNEGITSSNLEKVKDNISPAHYKILKMKYVDKLSNKEIADKMNITINNLYHKLKSAEERVNKAINVIEKNVSDTNRDKEKFKVEVFHSKLINFINSYSDSLTQEEINRVLRKMIK